MWILKTVSQIVFYLTGQVVAAYKQVRLTPHDFACLREAASAKAGGSCIQPFLSPLGKMTFSAASWMGLCPIPVKRGPYEGSKRDFPRSGGAKKWGRARN
ncbi:MAG: hypothetical protein A2W09_09520 [Deltaproteobacteria bacterium RBG_16_50_11]|nr:MAG: hypothetical protein A2W09_09520 [Deltaproteobacteria bacterium RBG_16_50_11]